MWLTFSEVAQVAIEFFVAGVVAGALLMYGMFCWAERKGKK